MPKSSRQGFILPFTLLLAASVLVLTLLALRESLHSLHRQSARLAHSWTTQSLRHQVRPLLERLGKTVLDADGSSALLPVGDEERLLRPVYLTTPGDGPVALHSAGNGIPPSVARFQSACSENHLHAGWQHLSPAEETRTLEIAWAAEDLSLMASNHPGPPFWPFPSFLPSPAGSAKESDPLAGLLPVGTLAQLPFPPSGEPLPFRPEHSPALVPVPRSLALHFGIFASGISGSREKVIRMRYYVEGSLWNPYNRPLQMHPGTAMEAAFQVVFWNLPRIRIHNHSMGIVSGWIDLSETLNSTTGAQGVHAFVRAPGTIEAGATATFLEPDSQHQPEGLARNLLPAFMVGPADWVSIEFEPHPLGVQVALVDPGEPDPLGSARSGAGWFRLEGWRMTFPKVEFDRADDLPAPFHLSGGSLSFRRENIQTSLSFRRPPESLAGLLDPRRRILDAGASLEDAGGQQLPVRDFVEAAVVVAGTEGVAVNPLQELAPLVSWPSGTPATPLAASDLPAWENGSGIGSPGAAKVNAVLAKMSWWPSPSASGAVAQLPDEEGNMRDYDPIIPVNCLSAESWTARLLESATVDASQPALAYPLYPEPAGPGEYREWDNASISDAAGQITRQLREAPCHTVAEFFNRGLLPEAIAGDSLHDPLVRRLPLRGWLRQGSPLRRHGAAWVLHIAIRTGGDGQPLVRSARIWLLEGTDSMGRRTFEIACFEWTDPARHLRKT